MTNEEILRLAEAIRNGKASEQEKVEFFKVLNTNLEEISALMAKMPKKEN